jgi:hypothetical protein
MSIQDVCAIVAVILSYVFLVMRVEARITKVETKMDLLLDNKIKLKRDE